MAGTKRHHQTRALSRCEPSPARSGELNELERTLANLEELLGHLADGALTPEQTHIVTYTGMPKLVLGLLKLHLPTVELCDRLNAFFQHVLRFTVIMLRNGAVWELIECTARILSDTSAYPIYNRPDSVGGGGGGSGGGGSGCDDDEDDDDDD